MIKKICNTILPIKLPPAHDPFDRRTSLNAPGSRALRIEVTRTVVEWWATVDCTKHAGAPPSPTTNQTAPKYVDREGFRVR